jgi:hypothetical protein
MGEIQTSGPIFVDELIGIQIRLYRLLERREMELWAAMEEIAELERKLEEAQKQGETPPNG